jgi:enoyl-CoA hydratase/carnithine racemase
MRFVGNVAVTLHDLPQPVIAQVEGVAAGAGANLAFASDFIVATPAARFIEIFTARGLSIDFGGSWLLPRLVGPLQAKRLALLAEAVGSAEALELGLVTWVREEAEIASFVADLAARLAALPPMALSQTKQLLNQGIEQSFRDAVDNEARAQAVNLATEDSKIAIAAFVNKTGTPHYTGRWALG